MTDCPLCRDGVPRIIRYGGKAYHEDGHNTIACPGPVRQGERRETTPIDGKFEVRDGRIVNKVSGEPIPDDEPRFLLRARDHHAYQTLMHYLALCEEDCNSLHLEGTKQTIRKFIDFANAHPERMKQPGVTKHLKLDAAASPVERAGETRSETVMLDLIDELGVLTAMVERCTENCLPPAVVMAHGGATAIMRKLEKLRGLIRQEICR